MFNWLFGTLLLLGQLGFFNWLSTELLVFFQTEIDILLVLDLHITHQGRRDRMKGRWRKWEGELFKRFVLVLQIRSIILFLLGCGEVVFLTAGSKKDGFSASSFRFWPSTVLSLRRPFSNYRPQIRFLWSLSCCSCLYGGTFQVWKDWRSYFFASLANGSWRHVSLQSINDQLLN